jgi:hypothetical protein
VHTRAIRCQVDITTRLARRATRQG